MAERDFYPSLFARDRLVHILDPDPATCEALSVLFRLEGFRTAFSVDTADFNAGLARRCPDAAVINLHAAGDGLAVLRRLKNLHVPVFAVMERPRVDAAVAAMKAGAADVVTKPIDADRLLGAVHDAFAEARRPGPAPRARRPLDQRDYWQLTPREGQVLQLISSGRSNKEASVELGISSRTVEVHRARVMEKLGARNTADLMRIILTG